MNVTPREPPRGRIGSPDMRPSLFPVLILLAGCDTGRHESLFRASGEVIAFSGGDGGAKAACFTCHGLKGEGDARETPRLAGLDAGYLHRQLDDYVAGRREHAGMRAIAWRLSGEDRAKVSAYYAAMPVSASGDGEANVIGDRLYRVGDRRRGLQACAACHGEYGEGNAGNPPLAGQPVAYLERQLIAWREGRRHNDPLGQMREISRRLTAAEVRAVAAHAAGLRGPGPPEAPAASPAAHRGDPRNGASALLRHGSGSSPPTR